MFKMIGHLFSRMKETIRIEVHRELSAFLLNIRSQRDGCAAVFTSLFLVQMSFIGFLAVSSSGQELARDRFQLNLDWREWAVIQVTPAMYNFENKIVYIDPTTEKPIHGFWVNHHTARGVYEVRRRSPLAKRNGCVQVLLSSRYRGRELVTLHKLCRDQYAITAIRIGVVDQQGEVIPRRK